MTNISQTSMGKQFAAFLQSIGENEPKWVNQGICNAFNVMAMRAMSAGPVEEERFYQRLEKLSAKDNNAVMELGLTFKQYRDERERLINLALLKRKEEKSNNRFTEEELIHFHQQTIHHLALNPKQIKLLDEAEDLYAFINSLLFFQHPGEHYAYQANDEIVQQTQFEAMMSVLPTDAKSIISPKKIYSFGFNFRGQLDENAEQKQTELGQVLLKILRHPNLARIASSDHVMSIKTEVTQDGIKYKLYNSNNSQRPVLLSVEELVEKIKTGFFTDFNASADYMPLRIDVYGNEQAEEKPRPAPVTLFDSLIEQRKQINKKLGLPFDTAESLGLNKRGFEGWTTFLTTIFAGNNELIKKLLEYKDIQLDSEVVLAQAIGYGQIEIVKALTDPILQDRRIKFQPGNLLQACRVGNLEITGLALAALKAEKVDVNRILDVEGNSAIQLAVSKHQYKIVELLLAAKPNLSHKNNAGMTALQLARVNKDAKMIALFEKAVKVKSEPLDLNKIHQFVFGDWADLEKDLKEDLSPENRNAKIRAKQERIRTLFANYKDDPALKALLQASNLPLANILYGDGQIISDPIAARLIFSEQQIDSELKIFEDYHGLLGELSDEKREIFRKLCDVCQFFAAFVALNEEVRKGNSHAVFYQAYKLLVLFGDDRKNIWINIDNYLKKFYRFPSKTILHDALLHPLPQANKKKINLAKWRQLIQAEGPRVFALFNLAYEVELQIAKQKLKNKNQYRYKKQKNLSKYQRILQRRSLVLEKAAPTTFEELIQVARLLRFKAEHKNRALANLFLQYNMSEESFNRALKYEKQRKQKDNLPNVIIHGKEIDPAYQKYHFVKLPIQDPHAYVLGRITNCCQFMGGGIGEICVVDGVRLTNNGFYVLLRQKEDGIKTPLVNDAINYEAFEIVGQGYAWRTQNNNLTLDSWENAMTKYNKIAIPFLKEFAKRITEEKGSEIVRVTIGIGSYAKTPVELRVPQCDIAEKMMEGTQHPDSKTQATLYCAPLKIALAFAPLDMIVADEDIKEQSSTIANAHLLQWLKAQVFSIEKAKKIAAAITPAVFKFLKSCPKALLDIPFASIMELLTANLLNKQNIDFILSKNGHHLEAVAALIQLQAAGIEATEAILKILKILKNRQPLHETIKRILIVLPLLKKANLPLSESLIESDLFQSELVEAASIENAINNIAYYEQSEWRTVREFYKNLLNQWFFDFSFDDLNSFMRATTKIKSLHLQLEKQVLATINPYGRNQKNFVRDVGLLVEKLIILHDNSLKDIPRLIYFICGNSGEKISVNEFKSKIDWYLIFKQKTNLSDDLIHNIVLHTKIKLEPYLKLFSRLKEAGISGDLFYQHIYHGDDLDCAEIIIEAVFLLKKHPEEKLILLRSRLYNDPRTVLIRLKAIDVLLKASLLNDAVVERIEWCGYMHESCLENLIKVVRFFEENFPKDFKQEIIDLFACRFYKISFDECVNQLASIIPDLEKNNLQNDVSFISFLLKFLKKLKLSDEILKDLLDIKLAALPNEAQIFDEILSRPHELCEIANRVQRDNFNKFLDSLLLNTLDDATDDVKDDDQAAWVQRAIDPDDGNASDLEYDTLLPSIDAQNTLDAFNWPSQEIDDATDDDQAAWVQRAIGPDDGDASDLEYDNTSPLSIDMQNTLNAFNWGSQEDDKKEDARENKSNNAFYLAPNKKKLNVSNMKNMAELSSRFGFLTATLKREANEDNDLFSRLKIS